MNNWIWTSVATLIGGVSLLVATRLFDEAILKPVLQFRRTVGEIAYQLSYYANVLTNPPIDEKRANELSPLLRQLSVRLRVDLQQILWYAVCHKIRLVPTSEAAVLRAHKNLMLFSNKISGNLDGRDSATLIKLQLEIKEDLRLILDDEKKLLEEIRNPRAL
jgi:hypothetical protein